MFNTVFCAIGMGSRERVHHLIDTSRELLAPGGILHFVHAVDWRAQLQQPVVVRLLWQPRRHDPTATFHEEPIYNLP